MSSVAKRMTELMQPIEQQIMMCDDREDTLMLACVMLDRVKTILDSQIGRQGRKTVLEDANSR